MKFGVAFDLDDTLYLERDYVASGFRAVAVLVATHTTVVADEVFAFLWDGFLEGVRGSSFDDLLTRFPEAAGRYTVPDLVSCYRDHRPLIGYLPGIEALLLELSAKEVGLAVISDGPLASQAAKAEALDVARYADPVILTDRWGKAFWKPHTRAFKAVAEAFALPPERLVYVGDNPEKDFHVSTTLGWTTVRLRLPEQVRYALAHETYPPTHEVTSVRALRELLLGLV